MGTIDFGDINAHRLEDVSRTALRGLRCNVSFFELRQMRIRFEACSRRKIFHFVHHERSVSKAIPQRVVVPQTLVQKVLKGINISFKKSLFQTNLAALFSSSPRQP